MLRRFLTFAIVGFVVAASLISAPPAQKRSADSQIERPLGAGVTRGP